MQMKDAIASAEKAAAAVHRNVPMAEALGVGRASAVIRHRNAAGVLLHEETVHNLITNAGRDFLHQQGYALSGIGANGLNYIALSNDTVGETNASTTLSNELASLGLTRAQGSVTHTPGTNTTVIDKTFTASGHVQAQKAALFTSGAGGIMNHVLPFTQRTLETADTIQITFTITLG